MGDVNKLLVFKTLFPQCFAFTPQANFPSHSLNFRWSWRWWDWSRLPFKTISTLTNHRTPDQLNGFSLVERIVAGRNFVARITNAQWGNYFHCTARPKINSHSQIFRYNRSIFCLPHRPKCSDFFDLYLHWVSVVRVSLYWRTLARRY